MAQVAGMKTYIIRLNMFVDIVKVLQKKLRTEMMDYYTVRQMCKKRIFMWAKVRHWGIAHKGRTLYTKICNMECFVHFYFK